MTADPQAVEDKSNDRVQVEHRRKPMDLRKTLVQRLHLRRDALVAVRLPLRLLKLVPLEHNPVVHPVSKLLR